LTQFAGADEQLDPSDSRYRALRSDERFELKDAYGNLIHQGKVIPVQFIDISLGGCCTRTEKPFEAGSLADVEVVLLLFGMVLRIQGMTQWVRENCQMGVRFLHPSLRSRNQLAGLLTCLVDESAAEDIQKAVASAPFASPGAPVLATQVPAVAKQLAANPLRKAQKDRDEAARLAAQPPAERPKKPQGPARSAEKAPADMEEGEHPGVLRFLNDGSHMACAITSLRLEGCKIRTEAPFTKAMEIRVEVCFQMLGLPFQLAGLTKEILDTHTVEIQFLEISRRKREELAQVIEELEELRIKKQAADKG